MCQCEDRPCCGCHLEETSFDDFDTQAQSDEFDPFDNEDDEHEAFYGNNDDEDDIDPELDPNEPESEPPLYGG